MNLKIQILIYYFFIAIIGSYGSVAHSENTEIPDKLNILRYSNEVNKFFLDDMEISIQDNKLTINKNNSSNETSKFDKPVFIRLSGSDTVNGWYYEELNSNVEINKALNLYIKIGDKEYEFNFVVVNSIEFQAKNAIPLSNNVVIANGDNILYWFPVKFQGYDSNYIVQTKHKNKTNSYVVSDNKFNIEYQPDSWRVFAYPRYIYDGKSSDYAEQFISNNNGWVYATETKENLFGIDRADNGHISEIPLFYPSSISFGRNESIILSADSGDVFIIRGDEYIRKTIKTEAGLPAALSNAIHLYDSVYIFTDNRSHVVYKFDARTYDLSVILGTSGVLCCNENTSMSLDTLGEINFLGVDAEDGYILSLASSSKITATSWYLKNEEPYYYYKLSGDKRRLEKISNLYGVCEKYGGLCAAIINVGDGYVLRKEQKLIKVNYSGGVIWSANLTSGFGSGLVLYNNMLYVGSHSSLIEVDPTSGDILNVASNIHFANIVDIKKDSEGNLVIVDSDSFQIHFGKIVDSIFVSHKTYGSVAEKYPSFIKVKKFDDWVYILTSNPGYLFKYHYNKGVEFIYGSGLNERAVINQKILSNYLFYPNDFSITKHGGYISESNHRMIKYTNNGVVNKMYGSMNHGMLDGEAPCDKAAYSGLKGIHSDDSGVYAIDSGNNRVLRIVDLGEGNCRIDNFIDHDLNFPTQIKWHQGYFYVIDQNNNVVKVFDGDGKQKNIIGIPTPVSYQGMGLSSVSGASINSLYFNTPTDIAFSDSGIYISDLFNGRVIKLEDDKSENLFLNDLFILPLSIESYLDKIYVIDSLSNTVKIFSAE